MDGPALSMSQLRDNDERTAFMLLLLFSIPVWLLILLWIVASYGGALVMIGIIFLGVWFGDLFLAAYIKTNGVEVTEQQLPELYAVIKNAAERLGMSQRLPGVYIMQDNVWNAFAAKLAGRRYVVLLSGAVDSILLKGDINQLAFVAGHELGHHAAGHLDFLTRCAVLGGWLPWFYLWYRRRCELTCDRVGLYCSGSLQASSLAMANMTVGAQLAGRVNLEEAEQQWNRHKGEFFVKYKIFYSQYPPNLWRLTALKKAAQEFGIADAPAPA